MLLNLLQGNTDLIAFLSNFLVSLPVFLVALTFHEAAHAYVAWRCGDPTAKALGRLTLNPLRHLDPWGFLLLFVAGVGWAKPVPVNPRNFRNARRDDFLVSIAGISMNLILCLLSSLAMFAMITYSLGLGPFSRSDVLLAYQYAIFGMDQELIAPLMGDVARYIYLFFVNLAIVNLSLAVFNLLPIPPLDGYHVFNDLLFKRGHLFASSKVQRVGMLLIVVLLATGLFERGLYAIINGAFQGMGRLFYHLAVALGTV